jgi:hypothetical protein
MDGHVRILSTLSMVFGALSGILGILTLIYFDGLGQLWIWAEASGGLGFLAVGSVLFHLLIALPMLLVGYFLRQFVDWARYVMVCLCAVNLLNVPLGSVLGGYGLWVLMTPETEPLFLDPVVRRNRALGPPQ